MPQFAARINAEKMKTQVNLDLMRDRQTDSLTNSTKEISSSEIRSSRRTEESLPQDSSILNLQIVIQISPLTVTLFTVTPRFQ